MRSMLLAATLMVTPLLAQTSPVRDQSRDPQSTTPIGTASIAGVVVISINGQSSPVRRARVVVRHESGTTHTIDTDTQGQFRVGQLPGGTYRIIVDKPGVVPNGREPLVALKDGQAAKVTAMMQRGAAIEGRLVTADGEPAMGLNVSAVRLGYGPYGKKAVAARQTTTDDLGRFRLHTLLPGEYYVEAALDPTRMLSGSSTPGEKPARTYYAGTPRLNEAQIVALAAEEQVSNVTFTVTSAALATMSGSVTSSAGKPPAHYSIRIQRVGAPPGEVRCVLGPDQSPNRTFQCPNVPPGDFWMLVTSRATQDADVEFNATRVTVQGQNLANLAVTTAPGARVSGRVEVEGGVPLPPNVQIAALETEYEFPAFIQATPNATPPVAIGPDGTFAFPSVAGLRLFRLDRLPEGWAVKGVWLDPAEISDTPTAFAVSERPAVLRVVVTSRTGSVAGNVLTADRQPGAGTRVIVFADDLRWWGARSRFIKTVEAGAAGQYAIGGLLPGQYRVAFVDMLADGAWEDPDVLARLRPLATPIVITGAERVTLDWRMR